MAETAISGSGTETEGSSPGSNDHLAERARQIATDVAAVHADDVDAAARFPLETITAVRNAGLLSAGLVNEHGRWCDVAVQSDICFEIGRTCASSGMVLAMHYIQMDCLAHHAGNVPEIRDYLRRLDSEQRLIASVTSEVGIDGDLRRSLAAVSHQSTGIELIKQATTVSYGQHADDFLITARASSSAAESDQVLVLALGESTVLESRGGWDTLGMRGTVSPGGTITTRGDAWQVLATPFGEVAPISMVPLSHLLWSACWLGIAHSALSRTRQAIQKKARRDQDAALQGGQRLASIHAAYRQLRTEQRGYLAHYGQLLEAGRARSLGGMAEIVRCNELKLNVSEGVARIVQEALQAVGIAAYRNGTDFSLGRHLRDALSASLMINNDRIRSSNASMQLVLKDQ